jgi:hypothetical protein
VKRFSLAAILLLLIPAATFAQGNPGPFGGLFGRTPQRNGVDYRIFELRGSAGWQWTDTVVDEPNTRPQLPFEGAVATSAASATFERRSNRFNFQLGSNVNYQHSLTSQQTRATTVDGGVLASGRITTRLSTEISANYHQSPYYQFYPTFMWQNQGIALPGLPYDVGATGYRVAEARIGGSFQYSKTGTLSASTSRSETWFPTHPASDTTELRYEGLWTRRLNRDFALRLGYGRYQVQHRTSALDEYVQEEIEAGIDFSKAFTLVPRTTLAITTQTSIIRQPDHDPHYRLNGEFRLTRRFQRTWRLEFIGIRSSEFLPGFVEPLLADSLSLVMSGMVSRRIEFATSLDGRRGAFGYNAERGDFLMGGSTTNLNIGITRHVGIYGRYGFYRHDAPADVLSLPAIGTLSRQTISAGITTWLPVFVRERTPSDSR